MLAYVIKCVGIAEYLKAVVYMRDLGIKYDLEEDKYLIYINEAEAHRCKLEGIEGILEPRKIFLRTVECTYSMEDKKIIYGKGGGLTIGTKSLLERARSGRIVEIYWNLYFAPSINALWVSGEGYLTIDKIIAELAKESPRVEVEILRNTITLPD